MNRTRIALCLMMVSVASLAWAGPVADPRGVSSAVAVSGVYTVLFEVNLGTAAPAGTVITCRAKIAPNLPVFDNMNRGTVPVESAVGVATVTSSSLAGSTANCSVEIPFAWTVVDAQNGVGLSYEVELVSGGMPIAGRSQQGISAPYPPAGGAARLNVRILF
jgi:hypothetical protein